MTARVRTIGPRRIFASACVGVFVACAGRADAYLAESAPRRVQAPPRLPFVGGNIDDTSVRAWGKTDGLPSGTVSGFAESDDGTLWIATEEGLLRFDGQRITALLDGEYASSVVATAGVVFVGTHLSGVIVLRDGRRVPSETTARTRGHPTGVLEPFHNGALLGTLDGMVLELAAGGVVRAFGRSEGLPESPVNALVGLGGRILVGTEAGLYVIDVESSRAVALPGTLGRAAIAGLAEADGAFVVATEVDGLWRCEGERCTRLTPAEGVPEARFGSAVAAGDGSVIVASSAGMFRVFGREVTAVSTEHRGSSVSLHVSRSGLLWLGAAGDSNFEGMRAIASRGVSVWHRGTASARAIRVLPDGDALIATDAEGLWRRARDGREAQVPLVLPGLESIRVLRPAANGSLLVGGLNGVLRVRADGAQEVVADSRLPWAKVRSVAEQPSGALLFATTSGLMQSGGDGVARPVEGISPTTFIFAVVELPGPRWLIATQIDGLFVLEPGRAARHVELPPPYERGSVLVPGRLGRGFVGVPHDRGVCVLDERSLEGRCFGRADGLERVTHLGAASDGRGRAWFPTNAGITSVAEDELYAAVRGGREARPLRSIRHFDTYDGMPVGECNGGDPNVVRLPDGRMAFACVGGVVVVDPERARIDEQPPHVLVESVDVDGVVHHEPLGAPLPAEAQRLTFSFSAPAFLGDEKRQKFLVKLEGFDRDWVEGDRATLRASYTNLPRGRTLRFSVRASNHDGIWNDAPATASFTIAARWYERLGVRLAGACAVAAVIALAFKVRTRNLVVRAKLLEAEVRARTSELVKAHEETERLLLNILPSTIAARLKAGERLIADRFEGAAVLFADVVGFTPRSAKMAPEALVRVLDELFLAFDAVLAEHRIEKVKTIGDAYMAVAGVPEPVPDAAARLARFALAARGIASKLQWPDGGEMQLRFGLHVGPVVAGVVGERKTIYDLWGDTVNLASRMETSGEPGRIHVTDAFARAIGPAFVVVDRGMTEVKGVGPVRTAWLEG